MMDNREKKAWKGSNMLARQFTSVKGMTGPKYTSSSSGTELRWKKDL
jgi:hypothetical protein